MPDIPSAPDDVLLLSALAEGAEGLAAEATKILPAYGTYSLVQVLYDLGIPRQQPPLGIQFPLQLQESYEFQRLRTLLHVPMA